MFKILNALFVLWCIFAHVNGEAHLARDFKKIQLSKDLVIVCNTNLYAKHWMLAVDPEHVIHVDGDKGGNAGVIRVQQQSDVDDESFVLFCYTHSAPSGSAERALKWKDVPVFYDSWSCNSEHYVRYWCSWSSQSLQTFEEPSKSCPISHAKYFTVYQHSNYEGQSWHSSVDDFIRCTNTPEYFKDQGSSIETFGDCVRIWEHANCEGNSTIVYPGTQYRNNFFNLKFNDILSSVSLCYESD